jgi:hypothetical protein
MLHIRESSASKNDWGDHFKDRDVYNWIPIHSRTISDLKMLPASHVLGQAVLVRTIGGLTAMVSIAEAAQILLDKPQSDLLWILTSEIERQLKADSTDSTLKYSSISAQKEVAVAELLRRELEKEKHERETEQREREAERLEREEERREREAERRHESRREEKDRWLREEREEREERERRDERERREEREIREEGSNIAARRYPKT